MKRSPRRDAVMFITPPFTPRKTSSSSATPVKESTPPGRRSPGKQVFPASLSPRGRKSPRFAMTRVGVALRPMVDSSPRKKITLNGSSYTSPKMGQLRITPIADSPKASQNGPKKEYTPGFKTPTKAARVEAIADRLSSRVNSSLVSRKRTRSTSEDESPAKKACLERVQGEVVPETPEKCQRSRKTTPSSTLCGLETIFDRIRETAHSSTPPDVEKANKIATDLHELINIVTKESLQNASPRSSPCSIRKSPRLIEKEKKRSQMRVTTKTERIVTFSPSRPKLSLIHI